MTINNAESILVIILASALAMFLILSIIIAFKTIALLNTLQRLGDKAEQIADKVENIGDMIASAVAPASFTRAFTGLIDTLRNRKDKGSKR